MISTLNLFSWNMASASSLLTTTLWKRCFSFTICRQKRVMSGERQTLLRWQVTWLSLDTVPHQIFGPTLEHLLQLAKVSV